MTTLTIGAQRLELIQGDITEQGTDAVVNAANTTLLGGGGVDGAIHRRGGPAILDACRQVRAQRYLNGLPVGEAVLTTGGKLPARYVIHTVGPVWRGGTRDEERMLRAAYENSLDLAQQQGLTSIAFPSISTGAYGFPLELAAHIALGAIITHLCRNEQPARVVLVLFYPHDLRVYRQVLGLLLPTLPPADAPLLSEY